MTAHKHAQRMMEYAKDALEAAKPWKRWERQEGDGSWVECVSHPRWHIDADYRRKPRTIRIGNYDVPEPMREAPEMGTRYWAASPMSLNMTTIFVWNGDSTDRRILERGLCHSTGEAAELHAKALLSLTEVSSGNH